MSWNTFKFTAHCKTPEPLQHSVPFLKSPQLGFQGIETFTKSFERFTRFQRNDVLVRCEPPGGTVRKTLVSAMVECKLCSFFSRASWFSRIFLAYIEAFQITNATSRFFKNCDLIYEIAV